MVCGRLVPCRDLEFAVRRDYVRQITVIIRFADAGKQYGSSTIELSGVVSSLTRDPFIMECPFWVAGQANVT